MFPLFMSSVFFYLHTLTTFTLKSSSFTTGRSKAGLLAQFLFVRLQVLRSVITVPDKRSNCVLYAITTFVGYSEYQP